MTSMGALVGLFVGGASRRMGGEPKGLLAAPDGSGRTLVERTVGVVRDAGLELVFVGDAPWLGGRAPDVRRITDASVASGPLAGLAALLDEAERQGVPTVIALACDMPYLTTGLVTRLMSTATSRPIVAPRTDPRGAWEALFARYEVARVRPAVASAIASGRRAMQSVFDRLEAEELALDDSERRALLDWDEPGDVTTGGRGA